jgi:hypothetical protein
MEIYRCDEVRYISVLTLKAACRKTGRFGLSAAFR